MARSRAKGAVTFDTVREAGLLLPGVEESTTFGKPTLKVRGKLLACVPSHKSAEPDSLVVRLDFEQRAELVAAEPDRRADGSAAVGVAVRDAIGHEARRPDEARTYSAENGRKEEGFTAKTPKG